VTGLEIEREGQAGWLVDEAVADTHADALDDCERVRDGDADGVPDPLAVAPPEADGKAHDLALLLLGFDSLEAYFESMHRCVSELTHALGGLSPATSAHGLSELRAEPQRGHGYGGGYCEYGGGSYAQSDSYGANYGPDDDADGAARVGARAAGGARARPRAIGGVGAAGT
jgi:hypothetical protein